MSSYNKISQLEAYLWEHHRRRSLRGSKYDSIPFTRLSSTVAVGKDHRLYHDSLTLQITWVRRVTLYIFLLYFVNLVTMLVSGLALSVNKEGLTPIMKTVSIITIVAVIVWEVAFGKKFRKTIYLDRKVIRIGKDVVTWNSISQVHFMEIKKGRSTRDYLLLVMHDDTIREYDLWDFMFGMRRLAFAIEHYKAQAALGITG